MPRLTVAHDYICPWCYVGWEQGKRLKREYPELELIWKGFELLPEGLEYTPAAPDPDADRKPPVPSRFELLVAADGITMPERTRPFSRSRRALEGAEYAQETGRADAYHDTVYHAYWHEDADISDIAVLTEIAERAGLDAAGLLDALESGRYRDRIVEFDEPAHAAGVWNVPTWMFPEKWVAEQPYTVVREYAARFMGRPGA
jgi:predicted DsbA family dithiol-disulfide isomerase